MEMLDVWVKNFCCAYVCFTEKKYLLQTLPLTLHKTPILLNVLDRFMEEHLLPTASDSDVNQDKLRKGSGQGTVLAYKPNQRCLLDRQTDRKGDRNTLLR